MSSTGDAPEDMGWQFDVDTESEELRLEHAESGSAYVLDADGGLRVPGESSASVEDAGEELQALRSTLESALEAETGSESAAEVDQQSGCQVECNQNGEVVIESDTKISLEAPVIDMSAGGQFTANSSGVMSLQGAIIQLN